MTRPPSPLNMLLLRHTNAFSIFASGSDPAMLGDRSRERRRMAAECLALARQISDSGVRASLVEMAQKWLDLAELCDHERWHEALRLRAVEAAIGRELRALYVLSPPSERLSVVPLMEQRPHRARRSGSSRHGDGSDRPNKNRASVFPACCAALRCDT